MNDDVSGTFLQSGANEDQEFFADYEKRMAIARELDDQAEIGAAASAEGFNITDIFEGVENRPLRWLYRLPVNMGVGAWRALGNTIDTASDVLGMAVEAQVKTATKVGAQAAKSVGAKETAGKIEQAGQQFDVPTLSQAYPELMQSFYSVSDSLEKHNRPEDDITAGITQFALPFMGWLKAFGGVETARKAATVGRAVAAEMTTAASAFDPHEGRFADLLQMGRELDGRFGEFLRTLSPDGSLVNRYIDYMTNRANEGPWEGRFKNAVDSVVTTAAIAGFVKAAARTYRTTRKVIEKKAEQEAARQEKNGA